MKMSAAIRLLQLLSGRPEGAMTATDIARRWDPAATEGGNLRKVQRYLSELSADTKDGPAIVGIEARGRERRYYLKLSKVANWFITEEAALDLLLTREILARTFGSIDRKNQGKLSDLADAMAGATGETKRLRERLRIVPDGIGRLAARIDPAVLGACLDSIAKNRKLSFHYSSAAGKKSAPLVSPQGLVAKDGTIYLVSTTSLGDSPRHFPLHRMTEADVHFQAAQQRDDFDLEGHIQASHQFSHALDQEAEPLELRLRVAPEAIFHFRERPLSADQTISEPSGSDDWHTVLATVSDTILLVPFLASMGPWIEVIGPQSAREKVSKWLQASAAMYTGQMAGIQQAA